MSPRVASLLLALGLGMAARAAHGGMASVPAEPELMAPITTSDYRNLTSGAVTGRLGRESKKNPGQRGRARVSMEIKAEPLIHGALPSHEHAQLLASAAAEHLKKKVGAISQTVSPTTAEDRKYKQAAYQRGESYAVKRFTWRGTQSGPVQGGGGRFDGGHRMFNFSGTFKNSIVATPNKTEGTATVNVAAIRLDPRTSRNAGEFSHITDALIRCVPELADPAMIVTSPEVKAAIDAAGEAICINAAQRNRQLRGQLEGKLLDMLLSAAGMGGLRGQAVTAIYG